tara:strand:- start:629 stop:1528 length:900 start_codon:yes stop_codon:yes gene_type:complete
MPPKHQAFCFTHNNYSADDEVRYGTLCDHWAKYLIFGKELAPTTQTRHLQGFLWTLEPRTLQQIKRKMPGAAVFVPGKTKGFIYHCDDDGVHGTGYCKKDRDFYEFGVRSTNEEFLKQCPKGQGTRSDLLNTKEAIDSGKSIDALLEDSDHFGTLARHLTFFDMYQGHKRRRKEFTAPQVHVRWGPTGTNKTRFAFESSDLDDLHMQEPHMGEWFDGFRGQRTVIINEFRGNWKFGMLLTLLDGYPTRVQVKGGSVSWSPTTIYITSPTHPSEWYPSLTGTDRYDQLERRITTITNTHP